MWAGYEPFLGYQMYSLGNQETGPFESGGNTILPNIVGACEEGFEIDPQTQTCVAKKFTPTSSGEGTQAMKLGCTDSNASNFNPEATTDDGSCQGGVTTMGTPTTMDVLRDRNVQILIAVGLMGFVFNMALLRKELSPTK